MSKKLRMINSCLDSIEFASEYGDKEELDKYIEISRWLIDKDEKDELFLEADKMFEELGFEKTVWGSEETLSIRYESKDKGAIVFDPLSKVFYGIEDFESKDITVEEHLAIHEKLKELGWLD